MQQNRPQEALAVLSHLRRLPPEHPLVISEYREIKVMVRFDEQTARSVSPDASNFKQHLLQYKSIFVRIGLFKRLSISCILQFFQQFTGINAVIYYAPTIFSSLGLDGTTTSLLATGVVGILNVVCTIPAILYLDVLGRRKTLILGALGMCMSHIIIAAITGVYSDSFAAHKSAGWAGVAFVYIFIANFAYSWGPVGWVLPSEIMPLSIRSKAMSISTSANWMMNFVVGRATPSMIRDIRFGTYVFFAVFCLLAAGWVYFFVPETKGKTLEEMDVVFKDECSRADKRRLDVVKGEVDAEEEGRAGDMEGVSGKTEV